MSAKNNGRRETDSFHNEVAFITFFKIMGPKIPSFTYYFNIFLVLFQSYVSSSLVSPHSAFESSSEKLLSAVESPMHSSYAGSPVIFRKSSPPPTVPMTTLDSFDGGPTSVSSTSGCGTATRCRRTSTSGWRQLPLDTARWQHGCTRPVSRAGLPKSLPMPTMSPAPLTPGSQRCKNQNPCALWELKCGIKRPLYANQVSSSTDSRQSNVQKIAIW